MNSVYSPFDEYGNQRISTFYGVIHDDADEIRNDSLPPVDLLSDAFGSRKSGDNRDPLTIAFAHDREEERSNGVRNTAFCINCDIKMPYDIGYELSTFSVRNTNISYVHRTAYCSACKEEIYAPLVNDKNVDARREAYTSYKEAIKSDIQ